MRKIIIESPYAGDYERNTAYARRALRDSLERDNPPEAALVSHLLYTQVLDDTNPVERAKGIQTGHGWLEHADAMVLYIDHGISLGMAAAASKASRLAMPIEHRTIGKTEEVMTANPFHPGDHGSDICNHIMVAEPNGTIMCSKCKIVKLVPRRHCSVCGHNIERREGNRRQAGADAFCPPRPGGRHTRLLRDRRR